MLMLQAFGRIGTHPEQTSLLNFLSQTLPKIDYTHALFQKEDVSPRELIQEVVPLEITARYSLDRTAEALLGDLLSDIAEVCRYLPSLRILQSASPDSGISYNSFEEATSTVDEIANSRIEKFSIAWRFPH